MALSDIVVMEIPSSKHMVDLAYRWPMEKAIETSIEATAFAHKNGLEVVFFPIDFSRAELKWAIDLIEKVGKEGHMGALALVDKRTAANKKSAPGSSPGVFLSAEFQVRLAPINPS